jgi:hypothetical protein
MARVDSRVLGVRPPFVTELYSGLPALQGYSSRNFGFEGVSSGTFRPYREIEGLQSPIGFGLP